MLELLPQILPAEDEDAAAVVRTSMERRGIAVRTGVSVEGLEDDPAANQAVLGLAGGGTVTAERVLVSVGRRPFTAGGESDGPGSRWMRGARSSSTTSWRLRPPASTPSATSPGR